MQDIFNDIQPWLRANKPFAVATVTRTWGSAPRKEGSAMAVTADMEVVGSVSGGCIEGAVIEEAQNVLKDSIPRLLTFGVSDETAWSVGLTCGGKVSVFVEKHPAFSDNLVEQGIWQALETALRQNFPVVLVTRLNPVRYRHMLVYPEGPIIGDFGDLSDALIRQARLAYKLRRSEQIDISGEAFFIQVFPRKERLVVVGAAHISVPLVQFAKQLQFEVVVIDPRSIFATTERFPVPPDQLITDWPQEVLPGLDINEDTYAVLLTHDPKIDDPALHFLLNSPVAYIGALGSRKTHAKRCKRLQEAGFPEEAIRRIQGPAGLDINALTPQEIALSIMAEVVQTRRHRGEA